MLMCVCVPRLVQYFLSTRTFFFTDNSLLRLCSPCKKEKVSRPFPLDCFLPFPFFRLFTNTLCVLLRMLQTSENHYVNMWKINIYLFAYIFPRYLSNFVGVSVCVSEFPSNADVSKHTSIGFECVCLLAGLSVPSTTILSCTRYAR